MNKRFLLYLNLILIVALSFTMLSCSSNAKSANSIGDLSGVWQDKECSCNVVIDFGGENKSLTVNDQKMKVAVKSFVNDKVLMSVEDGNGKSYDWEIIRVWDDNGSTFTLALIRDGRRESLSLIKKLS
jgi:hypothetical protein